MQNAEGDEQGDELAGKYDVGQCQGDNKTSDLEIIWNDQVSQNHIQSFVDQSNTEMFSYFLLFWIPAFQEIN